MAHENDRGRDEATLHAYHDGELGVWARWRFERRLERFPELRQELAALAALGDLVRGSEAALAAPRSEVRLSRRRQPSIARAGAPQRRERGRPDRARRRRRRISRPIC